MLGVREHLSTHNHKKNFYISSRRRKNKDLGQGKIGGGPTVPEKRKVTGGRPRDIFKEKEHREGKNRPKGENTWR